MGLIVAENITKVYSVVATKVSKDYGRGDCDQGIETGEF